MCCGVLQQGALNTGGKNCGPFIRVPSKRSRDAGEQSHRPLRHLPPGKAMRAGTSKRNWLLFWCPVFRHEAQRRVSAIAPAEPREKRAATVDVLVFGW